MFYKVVANIELANTESLLLGEIIGLLPVSFQSQHFGQLIQDLALWMFLLKDILLSTYF